MLDAVAIDTYISDLTTEQAEGVRSLRGLLHECSPGLTEEICTGKWYNGLLVYKRSGDDFTIYALGPLSKGFTTFHMMPYYASASLQAKHGEALKLLLSGKSCLKFKQRAELPMDALRDIITGGGEALAAAKATLARKQ